jgi:hypothetical protein
MRRKIDTIQLMRDINAVLKYVSCDLVYFISFLEVEGGKDRFLGIMRAYMEISNMKTFGNW